VKKRDSGTNVEDAVAGLRVPQSEVDGAAHARWTPIFTSPHVMFVFGLFYLFNWL
jgi:hypothetical protein